MLTTRLTKSYVNVTANHPRHPARRRNHVGSPGASNCSLCLWAGCRPRSCLRPARLDSSRPQRVDPNCGCLQDCVAEGEMSCQARSPRGSPLLRRLLDRRAQSALAPFRSMLDYPLSLRAHARSPRPHDPLQSNLQADFDLLSLSCVKSASSICLVAAYLPHPPSCYRLCLCLLMSCACLNLRPVVVLAPLLVCSVSCSFSASCFVWLVALHDDCWRP